MRSPALNMAMRRAAPFLLGIAALGLRLHIGPWPVDDAYITFRYAENLAGGLGLVYNASQPVLGTSAPAFALLLALGQKLLRLSAPWAAVWISAIADGVSCLILYHLARRQGLAPALAALPAALWAVHPSSLRYAAGGMETSLITAVLLGCFAFYLARRDAWAIALAGLAILIRPDAALAGALLLIALLLERRRLPWRHALILVGVLAPWLVFATWQYGSPFPHSALAKSSAIYLVAPRDSALQILFHLGGIFLGGPLGLGAQGIALVPPVGAQRPLLALAVLNFALWEAGAATLQRTCRRWLTVFAYPLLFVAIYALMGLRSTLVAEWYLVPLIPLWILGISAGLKALADRFAPPPTRAYALGGVLAALALAQLLGLNWGQDGRFPALAPRSIWVEREELYHEAASFLQSRLQSGDVVAASEIGALGYSCNCTILDTVGLISPEAIAYYPLPAEMYATIYAVPPDLIRDRQPTYLVSLDVFIRQSLGATDWFSRKYRLIWQRPTAAFGSTAMQIYARNEP